MQASGASVGRRLSPLGGVLKIMAVLAVAIGFGLAAERTDAVEAGHSVGAKPATEPVAAVAATDVETTSSIETKSPDDAFCNVSRQRLFVEGEGWIVRRVPTCY